MKQLAYAERLFVKGAPWGFMIFVWLIRRRPATRLRPQAGLLRGMAELCRTRAANTTHFNFNEACKSRDRRKCVSNVGPISNRTCPVGNRTYRRSASPLVDDSGDDAG
ncbi:MAG: hypothetical protein WC340_00540 [Kiritimatiellia bacterium]